jgi:hypothetical protein
MLKTKNPYKLLTNIFKENFRLIVFAVCISAVFGLIFFQIKVFTFHDYAPNLLAEITGMFLSNIFTLLIIDQYYRIQKEKEYSKTLTELNHKLKSLFHVYKKHFGSVFEVENILDNTDFSKKFLDKINLIQQENNDLRSKLKKFEFINSLEELGNITHSIIHILNILPSDFEIKDSLVIFEKINTTILILKKHIHLEDLNYSVFLNDIKYVAEQLLGISKNENFKEILNF